MTLSDDPLISAAMRLRPELDVVEATMLSGAAWRIANCAAGCRCAERRAAQASIAKDVERLHLRVHKPRTTEEQGLPELRRNSAPIGRRRQRDLDVLLGFAVWSLLPPVRDWCDRVKGCIEVRFGLAAYTGLIAEPALAVGWKYRRTAIAVWLLRRAGQQRTPYHNRLRWAGEHFAAESRALARVAEGAVGSVETATASARYGVHAVLDAALRELGLPGPVRALLLGDPGEPLTGAAMQEAFYFARAGRPALRMLAARRLASGEGPQVLTTLQQLLWEDYAPLADTALWSLGHISPVAQRRIATSVARSMLEDDPAKLRAPLVCAADTSKLAETVQILEEEDAEFAGVHSDVTKLLGINS